MIVSGNLYDHSLLSLQRQEARDFECACQYSARPSKRLYLTFLTAFRCFQGQEAVDSECACEG